MKLFPLSLLLIVLGIPVSNAQEGFQSLTPEQQARIKQAIVQGDEEIRLEGLAALKVRLLAFTDNSQDVVSAMKALEKMQLKDDEVGELYPTLLKSDSSWVRQISLEHLSLLPPEHAAVATVLPLVRTNLQDVNLPDFLRGAAARTLGSLTPDNATARELANLLDLPTSSSAIRLGALQGLTAIGKPAALAGEVVSRQLERGSTSLRYAALQTLVKIGGTEKDLKSKRGRKVVDAMVGIRALSERAIKQPKESELLMARQLSKQDDPLIKLLVLDELKASDIGETGSFAAVLNSLTSQDSFLTSKARLVLLSSKKLGAIHLPVLIEALKAPGSLRKEVAAHLIHGLGPAARPAVPTILSELRAVNARTSLDYRGFLLDALRAIGKATDDGLTTKNLLAILPESSPFLAGLSKRNANYTRGYLILTLSEIGMPEEGYPFVLDALVNSDQSMGHVFGAAAIASPSFVGKADQLGPVLARAFEPDFSDAPLYFERFGQMFGVPERATTARIEAIRALGTMGPAASGQLAGLKKLEAEIRKIDEPEILQVIIESIKKIETP
jgi:hypothetical protein